MAETDTFGSWVRRRRRELDLTQEELARQVGCARITIRKIEAEQLRPSKLMARLLGDRLGVTGQELENFVRFARGGASGPPATINPWLHNLPVQLTSLVGRESEVTEVHQLLQQCRLLTLTGAGGTGKTRLALQVAAESLDRFKHGVWFIELGSLSDPALVPSTVASVLGVREEQARPLMATLLDWLRGRQVLLILDNCEHMLVACAEFAGAVLHASRETRILASSRESLGISGESSYRVPSLACPDPTQSDDIGFEQLTDYPAVRLFVERATEALVGFRVTPRNISAVTEICHRLDGIPLAIELAAARVKVLHVEQIAARLDDRFRLLTSGSRTALPRHRTLQALIDWSHNLLSGPERTLLRRLSVFKGGWTLEAAEEVCVGHGIESKEILDLLTRLAEKSLIGLDEPAAEPRYRMLETIREYAGHKLIEAGERESLRDQHLRFFLKLGELSRPMLDTAERATWLARLEVEHDNVLASLEWACERDMETARWLVGILERFWFYGDHLSEGRTWCERVLQGREQAPVTRGLAMAVLSAGCVAFNLELMDEGQAALETAVDLWRQVGDPEWFLWALGWLAYLVLQRGEAARAQAIYTEHEALFRAARDPLTRVWALSSWGTAKSAVRPEDPAGKALLEEALSLAHTLQDPFAFEMCYSCLGDWAMLRGDYAAARRYFLDALEARRRLGTRWILAAGLWQVASILRLAGDYQQAEPMYAEALTMARALGDQRSEAHVAQELGAVAMHLGDVVRARTLLAESLSSFRKWDDPLGIARCLLSFSDLQQAQGHVQNAVCVLSFIETWLESSKLQLVHFDLRNFERSVAAARKELDEPEFAAWREAGTNMTLEQALSCALGQGDG